MLNNIFCANEILKFAFHRWSYWCFLLKKILTESRQSAWIVPLILFWFHSRGHSTNTPNQEVGPLKCSHIIALYKIHSLDNAILQGRHRHIWICKQYK